MLFYGMNCPSGKRSYLTKEDAEEALIGAHIAFHYPSGRGPVNIYKCEDCGDFHFTSQGPLHELLTDEEVLKRIKLEKEAKEWESRMKG